MTAPGLSRAMPQLVMVIRMATQHRPTAPLGCIRALLAAQSLAVEPTVLADLHTLHAEVLHQAGNLGAAVDACGTAAEVAGGLTPRDWPRLITALLVGADLAVCAGDPRAVAACLSARNAFTYLDRPDPHREQVAAGLHAVAVYHHINPDLGCRLVSALSRQAAPGSPHAQMLAGGLAAAIDRRGPHRRQPGTTPPLPGGLLQPRLDHTTVGYLAHRVRVRPAHHPAAIS